MKSIIRPLFLFVAVTAISFSCKGPQGDKADVTDKKDVQLETKDYVAYYVDQSASTVHWKGTKPTGEHYGTVQISEGEVKVSDDKIVGGSFTIDLNTIVCEDLEDPEMNGKLIGHLKSADFFHVDSFATANFEITEVKQIGGETEYGYSISGNLTMKDITKNITFKASIEMGDGAISAYTNDFIIDRTMWNVNYGSKKVFDNLKDNFIHDEIGLKIELEAKK